MNETGIEWTGSTWNPVTGCTPVSEGCRNCYARALAERLHRMGNPRYRNGFRVTLHPDKAEEPMGRKADRIFVNSMSDLLHTEVPLDYIRRIFGTMRRCPQHEFQILTKRPERWAEVSDAVGVWPAHVLPGATIEGGQYLHRLEALAKAGDPDTIRMVSVEPMVSSLCPDGDVPGLARRLRDCGIGWVITGGESGWSARPANLDWFREIRDACQIAGIPYFHKQHGGRGTGERLKQGGTLATLDGRLWKERPQVKTAFRLAA